MEELAVMPFPSSMQLNETTVSQCSQLLDFIHYLHAATSKEGFIFHEAFPKIKNATHIFEIVNNLFAKQTCN
jgi:hypothetical protein